MDKLGLYINNLMATVVDKEERSFNKKLAFNELQRINHDIGAFLLKQDEILNGELENSIKAKEKSYQEHWTCEICNEDTSKVEYDYLSGTDHLECVLKQEQNQQLELELRDVK